MFISACHNVLISVTQQFRQTGLACTEATSLALLQPLSGLSWAGVSQVLHSKALAQGYLFLHLPELLEAESFPWRSVAELYQLSRSLYITEVFLVVFHHERVKVVLVCLESLDLFLHDEVVMDWTGLSGLLFVVYRAECKVSTSQSLSAVLSVDFSGSFTMSHLEIVLQSNNQTSRPL